MIFFYYIFKSEKITGGDILTLYDKVKSLADDQNISISYIEESTQLSNGSISKWKVNSPIADSLYKVAKFLGCSVDYLISDEN